MREWAKSNGRTGKHGGARVAKAGKSELDDEKLREQILKIRASREKLSLEKAKLAGKLVDREEVERDRVERVLFVRSKLLAGPAFVFPDDPENQAKLREWVLKILKEFSGE